MAVLTKQVQAYTFYIKHSIICVRIKKTNKTIHETWVNIRQFYEKDTVLHEHPSVKLKGQRFMTTSIEEC